MSQDRRHTVAATRDAFAGRRIPASIRSALLLLLALTAPTLAWAACGCTGITVTHTDNHTVSICSNADIDTKDPDKGFPECQKTASPKGQCGNYHFRYDCPVGVNSVSTKDPVQQTGFLVEAQLSGTASQCQSGHALQLAIKGGKIKRPKVHKTPSGDVSIGKLNATIINDGRFAFPAPGTTKNGRDQFGADYYTDPAATDVLIQQDKNSIKWWDNTDQGKDNNAEHAVWSYRYLSYVKGTGSNNSCACVFDIDVDWSSSKNASTKWTKVDAKSTNCTFTP